MTLAIFTEGTDSTDPKKSSFVALWTWLATRAGAPSPPRIVGFSKGSLVNIYRQGIEGNLLRLGEREDHVVTLDLPRAPPRDPLDILIERAYTTAPFERLVLAFDREPKHNALKNKCRRAELLLTLTNLAASRWLPIGFREAAAELRSIYLRYKPARLPGQRLPVEIIVMERLFEDLLLCDEKGFRIALGLDKYPKDWPTFKNPTPKPDEFIFKRACRLAPAETRHRVGDQGCDDKHKWAKYVLERLPESSPTWTHPIFVRLQNLVA